MTYDRRSDRRSGGGRPSGGRPSGGRPDRPPRDREGGFNPAARGGRPPQRSFERSGTYTPRPREEGGYTPRPREEGGYTPRPRDEPGMSIRLDPRRLAALKLLAGEQGLRPGELVTRWVEERLDAARAGQPAPTTGGGAATGGVTSAQLEALASRVNELASRLDAFTATAPAAAAESEGEAISPQPSAEPKRRGRPRKNPPSSTAEAGERRVPLHEEIIAVIGERGPMTAGELASAIAERGRYAPPRSAKPLDAATVNARVSNPVYRARFSRDKGRIGLANAN